MEATCSTETSVDFQQTTQRYIPKSKLLYDWLFTAKTLEVHDQRLLFATEPFRP
jgi:hypothetical protein